MPAHWKCQALRSFSTRPTTNRGSRPTGSPRCSAGGGSGSARTICRPAEYVGDRYEAILGGHVRRRQPELPRRSILVEDSSGFAAALGADGGVLSGHRPCAGEKDARHARNAAEQPGRTLGNRPRQAADHHALQHCHGRAEPGEHGHDGPIYLGGAAGVGMPPPAAIVAVCVALLPIAAFFMRFCLALAAFARSTKEGQYYLMPLLMLTMPLIILPMSPGRGTERRAQPDPGYRHRAAAAKRAGRQLLGFPRCIVRWWRRSLWRRACWRSVGRSSNSIGSRVVSRKRTARSRALAAASGARPAPTPTASGRGVLRPVDPWRSSSGLFAGIPATRRGSRKFVIPQLPFVAPPLFMMILLKSSLATLLLNRRRVKTGGGAVALFPAGDQLAASVSAALYPVSQDVLPNSANYSGRSTARNVWFPLLLVALVPAVCEEIAFRGFILSGFRHLGHRRRAIVDTALLFGRSRHRLGHPGRLPAGRHQGNALRRQLSRSGFERNGLQVCRIDRLQGGRAQGLAGAAGAGDGGRGHGSRGAHGMIIGDINSRRGRIEGMEHMGGSQVIKAIVPLKEMFGYVNEIRSSIESMSQSSTNISTRVPRATGFFWAPPRAVTRR